MELTLQTVRVYASTDQYGDTPRHDPLGGPIEIKDFPEQGQSARVFFGDIPDFVIEGWKLSQAIGQTRLSVIFRGQASHPGMTRDMQIEDALSTVSLDGKLTGYKWFVTVVLDTAYDLPDEFGTDEKHMWIEYEKASQLSDDFISGSKHAIDILTVFLITIIPCDYFHRTIFERAIFRGEGRRPLALPIFKGSATAEVTRKEIPKELLRLKHSPNPNLGTALSSDIDSLAGAAHFYLAALQETDDWKKFLFSFLSLEKLTHRLAELIDPGVKETFPRSVECPKCGVQFAAPGPTPPLVPRFKKVATKLSPDTAEKDIPAFEKANLARNKLFHGSLAGIAKLKTAHGSALELLTRYFNAAIRLTIRRR